MKKPGQNYLIKVSSPQHKQLKWPSLVQFWGFIVMRCLTISSLSNILWLSTTSYTTFIAVPLLPNLSFLEQLPLPIATRAHTGIWIGGGVFLTNDLTNNSARAKEREPHHFFLSLHWWSVSVCQALLLSLSPLYHLVTVFGERKRRRMIINLLHQSLSADTSSQKPLSTWCLTKLH